MNKMPEIQSFLLSLFFTAGWLMPGLRPTLSILILSGLSTLLLRNIWMTMIL